ncbi:MAG: tetratricopeptide repeat protein [Chloroflexota bacterium]
MEKQDFSLITALKDIYPEEAWPWAIPALRREPLIWETLQGDHFRDKAQKEVGSQAEKWTPARLGVIALNLDLPVTLDWPLLPFNELQPELRQRVYKAYQDFTEESSAVKSLSHAFLLALGMKEEKDAGKTWEELLREPISPFQWRGPLVCLYEMLDSPTALLKTLPGPLGIHIVLSRPASPTAHKERIKGHLSLFPRQKQLDWLQVLREEKPEMAAKIAKTLASSPAQQPSTIAEMIGESQILQFADNPHKALQLLERASSLHQELKGSLAAQINAHYAWVEAPQLTSKAWQDVIHVAKNPSELKKHADALSDLLRILTEKGFYAAAENLVDGMEEPYPDHPGLLTELARYALSQDETERAQQLALRGLTLTGEDLPAPASLSAILFDLGLFEKSIQAAQSTLAAHPDHQETLVTLAKAQDQVGDHPRAIQHAQLAVLSRPADIDIRRQFAAFLEHGGEWEAALKERSSVLAKLQGNIDVKSPFEPYLPHEDLHALANCAYHAQKPARAVKACENILNQNPDDGLAHATLGKSLLALGKRDEGFAHLKKATDIASEEPDPWLALAQGQREQGDEEGAIQTLKMGANAADQRAKIFLALGKIHINRQAQSKALDAFQKSAQLAANEKVDQQTEQEIGYQLGKTYYQLGHLKEARDTLRDLKERFPGNQKTHYIYGQILLDMDEPRGALPYLAQVVDSQPDDVNPYLDYADAHLRIGANPKIAIKTLNQVLEIDPKIEKAQALLAEAYEDNGEWERALSHYQKAMESELSRDPSWGPRITTGFGKTALNLGQTETALATLKEGLNKNPHHLGLAQTLAKAFAKAELANDALETIQKALDIAPDDLKNLDWVADFALDLKSPRHAIPALEEIINLEPERTQTYIKLGKAHRLNKDQAKAKEVFSRISTLDQASAEGLFQAGDELLNLGDIEEGMSCLEKAAHVSQANAAVQDLLPKIWARLADGYAMNGDSKKALDLLDQAIEADLDQPTWRIKKADFLVGEERYQAALASLKNALDLSPQNPILHYKTALVYRQIGNYTLALKHATQAVELHELQEGASQADLIMARTLAADIASATLQPELAVEILDTPQKELLTQLSTEGEGLVDAVCTLGELALNHGEEVQAAQWINGLLKEHAEESRVLALQARLIARQGKYDQARSLLEDAVAAFEERHSESGLFKTSLILALAQASWELHNWDQALAFYREAAQESPQEVRSQYEWTKALVRRAEIQRFAGSLKVIHHAPGQAAFGEDAKASFQKGLTGLKAASEEPSLAQKWAIRGQAVFHPTPQTTQALEGYAEDPEDLAALLAALRAQRHMDQAAKRAIGNFEKIGVDQDFDAQVALSILNINPEKALEAAGSALEVNQTTFDLQTPMYTVLKAMAAEKNRDMEGAYQSVTDALQIWNDEPRWHALAAEYSQDPQQAVQHLERAIELEPTYAGHHLALGKRLLANNQPESAVESLKETIALIPEQVEGWITLSRSHHQLGDLEQSLTCAQQAVEYAPDHREARMLLAELAFEAEDYQSAESHLRLLVKQDPEDPQALALLSQTLAAQQRPQQALEIIEKAIPLNGECLDLKLQHADLIKEVDGTSAGIDALRVIGSHYPDEYRVVTALVKALAEGGETDQAISTAKTILSKDDVGHTPSQKSQLHLLTGRLLRKEGQLDQAVHHFNEAKKLDPQGHESYLELGRTHLDRREYDRALERLNKSIELAPHEAMAYFYAGKVLKELKHYERAERMLRQASKLAPNNLRIHRQLGVLVTLNLVHGNRNTEEILT